MVSSLLGGHTCKMRLGRCQGRAAFGVFLRGDPVSVDMVVNRQSDLDPGSQNEPVHVASAGLRPQIVACAR